jgi:hypothetical protein
MSPRSKSVSADVIESETEAVTNPVKDIKEIKEQSKIMEQSIVDEYEDDEIDISPQKYITVISLTPNQLNLSTQPNGKGKVITFNSWGEKKRIMYLNLVDIMDTYPSFLEKGYYYIAEKRVIRKHGLDSLYSTLLTKETIENMLSKSMSDEDTATLYKSANKTQQGIIIDLVIKKLVSDSSSVDMNMVANISKISGVDILKKIEEDKFYSNPVKA